MNFRYKKGLPSGLLRSPCERNRYTRLAERVPIVCSQTRIDLTVKAGKVKAKIIFGCKRGVFHCTLSEHE